jgi:aspartyl protease family protein
LNELAAGPECIGSNCYIASSGPQVLTMNADPHGHFHTGVSINGVEVMGVIDTGATLLTMSAATANSMGITTEGSQMAGAVTANGNITTFNKMVPTVRIGDIVLDNVEIAISEKSPTLIGMSVLKRLNITESNGQMILSR